MKGKKLGVDRISPAGVASAANNTKSVKLCKDGPHF